MCDLKLLEKFGSIIALPGAICGYVEVTVELFVDNFNRCLKYIRVCVCNAHYSNLKYSTSIDYRFCNKIIISGLSDNLSFMANVYFTMTIFVWK